MEPKSLAANSCLFGGIITWRDVRGLVARDLGLAQLLLRLILKMASDVYNVKFGNKKNVILEILPQISSNELKLRL